MQDINTYIARSVIRHLNGDFDEFERLKGIALKIYHKENSKDFIQISELVPMKIKERMYKLAN